MKRYLWVLPATALVLMAVAPTSVTLYGTFQNELGCSSDNNATCTNTDLVYSAATDKWTGTFTIPSGPFTYKAALNHASTTTYPTNAISITGAGASVKFYYDDATNWVGDSVTSTIATVAGDFQMSVGCSSVWDPSCLRSMLTDPDGDGIYTFTTSSIPAGNIQYKVAYNEQFTVSYGDQGGPNNIHARVTAAGQPVTFAYNPATHWSFVRGAAAPQSAPGNVTIAGTFQSELGCTQQIGGSGGDWEPPCAATHLTYDGEDDLWEGTFNVIAGAQQYKAALNDAWTVSYGVNGGGTNAGFNNPAAGNVKFYYDDKSHVVTDSLHGGGPVAAAVGDWQGQVGCAGAWDPACLRGFLSDPDGDGVYDVVVPPIPAGTWAVKVAHDEAWTENYGAGCAANGGNIPFTVPAGPPQPVYFAYRLSTHCLSVAIGGRPRGDLRTAKAHWLDQTTIAWDLGGAPPTGATAQLFFSPTAGLSIDPALGLTGGTSLPLTYVSNGLTGALAAKYPHLANLQVFSLGAAPAAIKSILQGQVAVGLKRSTGEALDATSLQIPGVLDTLYAASAKPVALGATWAGGVPTLRVWAPTAQDVKVELFADAAAATTATEQPMTLDQSTGVWSATGQAGWKGQYYTYKATVYTRATRAIEVNHVPDPYSVDASINAGRSHLIDLADASTKPANWDSLSKPALASALDIVLYELHIRDFSAYDQTVPAMPVDHRGKYLAFADATSDGMKHLKALADAGLTHVHLLPAFDIASVDENASTWTWQPTDFAALAAMPPESQNQQAFVAARQNSDGFNWGYDPVLYGVPEGSYATDPNGGKRVVEFRQMVQGLNAAGLRVVMDVVYNHTSSSGQNPNSVLDKIVPGYYHRLDLSGNVEHSSCCENTATEHAMMGKLTVDTLVTWAREFKVSGFRFDLMGHMPKQVLVDAQTALQAVDPAIYLYGEGWDFGEVAGNHEFVQGKQADMAGTGIGTFNDRIRDAVRGGSPFTPLTDQGFGSGLLSDPNAAAGAIGAVGQKNRLLAAQDLVRLSLAGNLKTYDLQDSSGATRPGVQLSYNGNPGAGYTAQPQESINYVSVHDNMTLFDAIQVKAPAGAELATRIRYNNLALAVVLLSQGVPFFHAGDEILRSKSGDNNSFNSGDWFNRIDWSLATNGWGSGLPLQGDNGSNWNTLRPLLANTAIRPAQADMARAMAVFTDFLKIRKAEPVLRLATADAIQHQVTFYDTGVTQSLGLIVEKISASAEGTVGEGDLAIFFNATPDTKTWQNLDFARQPYELHEIQAGGADDVVKAAKYHPLTGKFEIPGRSAVVFRNTGKPVKALSDPIAPTCSCSSSATTAAAGLALLALATLRRRRRAAARAPSTHSRY